MNVKERLHYDVRTAFGNNTE